MKLKKRIKMFEDFASTAADSSNSTTPSSVTTSNSVAVDKTNTKSGEAIRTEVIKDVDTILNNLAELSNQITEELNVAFADILSEDVDLIAEAGAGDELMKMFKSMASFTKLASSYGKLADKKKSLETDKKVYGFTFPLKKDEVVAAAMDKQKEALNKKIEAIDDPAKRKEARITRDAKLEEIKAKLTKKADQQKEDKDRGFDRDVADTNDAITKLTGDNKIESTIISAKWDAQKLAIDRKLEDKYIAVEREAIAEYVDDPERQKRLEAAIKERAIKDKAEAAKQLEAAKARAEKEQAELDAKIANASEDEKEALEKIKTFNAAYTDLAGKLGLDADSSEEEVNAAKEASSNLDGALNALGTGVMKKAFGYENDADAETALSDFTERESELQSEYKANKALVKGTATDDGEINVDDEEIETELTDEQKKEIQDKISALETKIASGESKKEGKPEEIVAKIEQSLAAKRKELEDLKAQLGESFGSYEQTMATLTEMESSIDKMLEEFDMESVSEEEAVCEKCGEVHEGECATHEAVTESFAFKSSSVADRFRSLM